MTETLRVLRGSPTENELAALVAVLLALTEPGQETGQQTPAARGSWADPRRGLPTVVAPGPGAWAAAGRIPGARTRAGW